MDENDNEPVFLRLTSEGRLVVSVDWQTPLLTPILRIQAVFPLSYSMCVGVRRGREVSAQIQFGSSVGGLLPQCFLGSPLARQALDYRE